MLCSHGYQPLEVTELTRTLSNLRNFIYIKAEFLSKEKCIYEAMHLLQGVV